MLAIAATLCAAGCSRKIDTDKLEKHIAEELKKKSGTAPEKVDCPDDVTEKKGDTFECTAKADDGSKATITVEMSGEGEVSWKVTAAEGAKKAADEGPDKKASKATEEPNEPSADEGKPDDDEPSEDEF